MVIAKTLLRLKISIAVGLVKIRIYSLVYAISSIVGLNQTMVRTVNIGEVLNIREKDS